MSRQRQRFDSASLLVPGSIFLFSCLFLFLLALITGQVAYLKAREGEQKAAQAGPAPTVEAQLITPLPTPWQPTLPHPLPTRAEPAPSSLAPTYLAVPGSMGIYLSLTKTPRPGPTPTGSPTATPTSTASPTPLPVPGSMAMYLFRSKTPPPRPTRLPIAIGTMEASPAPTSSPTPAATSAPLVHTIQEGDTLLALANRYGVSVEAIQEANGILDPARLQIGQEIIIPREGEAPLKPPTLTPAPTPTATPIWGTVSADILNLRAGPSLDEMKIGRLSAGTKLELLGRNEGGDWLWIRTEDGRKGWVAAEFVQTEADLKALPLTF